MQPPQPRDDIGLEPGIRPRLRVGEQSPCGGPPGEAAEEIDVRELLVERGFPHGERTFVGLTGRHDLQHVLDGVNER